MKRPTDPNPLFGFTEETHIVHDNAMQRQRKADGTPYTTGGATRLAPPDMKLRMDGISKSEDVSKSVEATRRDDSEDLDPDEVVKSWLSRR